jgi:Na+/alanine symporter
MKVLLKIELFWMFVFLLLAIIAHFSGRFLFKKYKNEKMKIENLKEAYPNKSFLMKQNINEHLLKSQAKMLLYGRFGFLLFAIILLFKAFFKM